MSESTLSEDWRRDHWYYETQAYLHDFKGYSQKQKLLDDLSDYVLRSKLEWSYKNGLSHYSQEVCIVSVTEPETGEILDIGGSLPGDLFVDNFGLTLSSFFTPPIAAGVIGPSVSVKNTAGAAKTIAGWGTSGTATDFGFFGVTTSGGQGSLIQIGSGLTAPARSDVAIQTAFSTAPENALFNTGIGSYSAGSGTITLSGSITAGNENGTINEALLVLFGNITASNTQFDMAIAHDATTATAFSNAKSITVQYSITD